jgi:hypothetical protein
LLTSLKRSFHPRADNDENSRMGDPGFIIIPTVNLLYVPDATLDSVAGGFRGTLGPSQAYQPSPYCTIAVELYLRPSNIFTHVVGDRVGHVFVQIIGEIPFGNSGPESDGKNAFCLALIGRDVAAV